LSDSQTHNLTTTLIGSEHKRSSEESYGVEKLLTPLIFSPFGIKYQKEKKKKRDHSSLSESTRARPATWVCEVKHAKRRGGTAPADVEGLG